MDIKEKILTILGVADGPMQPDLLSLLIAKERRDDLNAAILELALAGKVVISSEGVSLPLHVEEKADACPELERKLEPGSLSVEKAETAVGIDDALDALEGDDFEKEFDVMANLEETDEPDLAEGDELGGSGDPDEDIPWPWHESEYVDSNGGLSEWPWAEFANCPPSLEEHACAGDAERVRPLFVFDPIDALPVKKNSITKAKAAGVNTVGDLLFMSSQLAGLGISEHVRSVLFNAVESAALRSSCLVNAEQVSALQSVSGSSKYIIDPFGRVSIAPCLQPGFAARDADVTSGCFEDALISDILDQEPILKRLKASGIFYVSDFESWSEEEILAIRGFGLVKLNAVKDAIAGWRGHPCVLESKVEPLTVDEIKDFYGCGRVAVVEEALRVLDPDRWLLQAESFVVTMLPFASADGDACGVDDLIAAFWEKVATERCASELLSRLVQNPEIKTKLISGDLCIPDTDGWGVAVRELVDLCGWDYDPGSGKLAVRESTLDEWLAAIDERKSEILRARFSGKTLVEVGDEFDLTRERVRQIVAKELSRRPALREDAYAYFVATYAMSEAEFCDITALPPVSFGYLLEIAETRKADRKPLVDAVGDDLLPSALREAVGAGDLEGFILLDGEQVPLNRYDITLRIVSSNAFDKPMSADVLYQMLIRVLDDAGVPAGSPVRPVTYRAFTAWLIRQEGIIYAPVPKSFDPMERCVRLYSYDKDFDILKKCLDDFPYRYVACSAGLMFESEAFRDGLAELDIRNMYELHQLLREYCSDYPGLEMGKTPMLSMGGATHAEQMLLLVDELGPISGHDLAAEYAARYGMDAFTVGMNLLKEVEAYRAGGMYSFGGEMLPPDQMIALRKILDKDVCVLSDVREAFVEAFPTRVGSDVSFPVLLHLGYEIRRGLVLKRGVNPRSFFQKILNDACAFREGDPSFPEEFFRDDDFKSELNMRLRSYDLVEVSDGCYERLGAPGAKTEGLGLDSDMLRSFTSAFIEFMDFDVPQTVHSAVLAGFDHPLVGVAKETGLGFKFLEGVAGIGFVGGKLKRTSMGGVTIFARRAGAYNASDFLGYLMRTHSASTAEELKPILEENYGIETTRAKLRQRMVRVDSSEEMGE